MLLFWLWMIWFLWMKVCPGIITIICSSVIKGTCIRRTHSPGTPLRDLQLLSCCFQKKESDYANCLFMFDLIKTTSKCRLILAKNRMWLPLIPKKEKLRLQRAVIIWMLQYHQTALFPESIREISSAGQERDVIGSNIMPLWNLETGVSCYTKAAN